MQSIFRTKTAHLEIDVRFHLMAPYSPKLNLVEYAIHWIRQELLHHSDYKTSLAKFETSIKACCEQKIFSKEQIINILEHINLLVLKFPKQ